MDQTETDKSEWDDVFDMLDTRRKGYLTANDIVKLNRDVQNSNHDHDDDAVVSVQMAERMLSHLIQHSRPSAITVTSTSSSNNTRQQTQTATTAPTMSRAEFDQFMSPSPPPRA
jgi:hypothetical protein